MLESSLNSNLKSKYEKCKDNFNGNCEVFKLCKSLSLNHDTKMIRIMD